MKFQVPQFLDVEDKIIGPLTMKQFLYVAGGFGMGYMAFRFIPWAIVGLIPAIGLAAFGTALAFYRFNNKPFIYIIEAAFHYFQSTRLYLWRRREQTAKVEFDLGNFTPTKHERDLPLAKTTNKLDTLSWEIDVEKNQVTPNTHSTNIPS